MSSHISYPAPKPLISYCAIHQASPRTPQDSYCATMLDLHRLIHKKSADLQTLAARRRESLEGTIASILHLGAEAGTTKAMISLLDSIMSSFTGEQAVGLMASQEGRITGSGSSDGVLGPIMERGNEYLARLGFSETDQNGLFESVFIVEGGANLDVLEQIVRDMIGIYGTTHGKHIEEFNTYCYYLHNKVFSNVAPEYGNDRCRREAMIFFSKPGPEKMKYAPFRSELEHLADNVVAEIEDVSVSLWQRKLGLGAGSEFVLRIRGESPERLSDCIRVMKERAGPVCRTALLENGAMIVKEILMQYPK